MKKENNKWWERNDIRVLYHFDRDTCVACLCNECGSSIKRKFLLNLFPIRKEKGCLNHKCVNYFRNFKTMEKARQEKGTKALLYWLRHNPSDIAIEIKKDGWTDLNTLVDNSRRKYKLSKEEVEHIVSADNKGRLEISEDGNKIRSVEGHTTKMYN